MSVQKKNVQTDVLIVGAGPAGGTAAAILSSYDIDNILINKYGCTAQTPRAHITNQRTMEVFRDLNLEDKAISNATPRELMGEHIYATSLVGEELGRLKAWGNHSSSSMSHEMASPTRMCDLPQDRLEPLLINAASARGSKVRFNTEYVCLAQDEEGVTVTVTDHLIGLTYDIRARYVIGADGGRSKVAEHIRLPFEGRLAFAASANIVFKCDLHQYCAHRPGVIYWMIQPDGCMGNGALRMVEPWNRWVASFGIGAEDPPDLTEEFALMAVHRLIGTDSMKVEIESVSPWSLNNYYATENMNGRVFCVGDAVHRHPPTNGLGSNTSIQDAFNLCWKLKLVLEKKAGSGLLETYQTERVPVGKQIVVRAFQSLMEMGEITKALGLTNVRCEEDLFLGKIASRKGSNQEAAVKRDALRNAIALTRYNFDCHGLEVNHRYESDAVVPDGTPDPVFKKDKELFYQPSSRPGSHVPHAWLSTWNGHKTSTIDLCGKGSFTLLTGIGGEGWLEAAQTVEHDLNVELLVHIIGPGQQYYDVYGDFSNQRETFDNGVILVRPDLVVGWRAKSFKTDSTRHLLAVMRQILGWA